MKEISLMSGEAKIVTLKTFGGNNFEKIIFNSGNETYSALVYSQLNEIPIENKTIEKINKSVENDGNKSEEKKSFWEMIFGGKDEKNQTVEEDNLNQTNNESNNQTNLSGNQLGICEEFSFQICSSEQRCEGKLVEGDDGQCCDGACIEKEEPSSSWKTIGWIVIGAAAIFLVWFFKAKYSKTRKGPIKLSKK